MKYIVLFINAILLIVACSKENEQQFVLDGEISGLQSEESVYLQYPIKVDGIWYDRTDTIAVVDGRFNFEGNICGATPASLIFDGVIANGINIYLEPTRQSLMVDKSRPYDYILTGSNAEIEQAELRKRVASMEKRQHDALMNVEQTIPLLYSESTEYNKDSLQNVFYANLQQAKSHKKAIDSIRFQFAKENPNLTITPNLLYTSSKWQYICNDTLRLVYETLPTKNQNSLMGQIAKIGLAQVATAQIGDTAPNFVRAEMSGDTVRLADYLGKKYVLLDFWASWCAPCLKEIPHLKDLCNKYSDLQIIGITSNKDKHKWQEAIYKHDLTSYPQVMSLQTDSKICYTPLFRKQFDIGELYDVESIPQFILIDKRGKIVARWQNLTPDNIEYLDALCERNDN